MHPLFFILISVAAAACIGGVTNYLAIKMLFHPHNKRYVAGRRIPFTPGLIPKRKEEIARSLGNVVGDYLVTSEGLTGLLQKPEFKRGLEAKINRSVADWTKREETLEQLALRFWTADEVHRFQDRLVLWLREMTANGISWFWDRQEQSSLKLGHMIPDLTEQRKEQFVLYMVDYLIREIKEELRSAHGDRLLRQLTGQILEQTGGLLGTLAGIFMDEEKMVHKVKDIIDERIESPRVKKIAADFLYKKVGEWEDMRFSDAVEAIAQQDGKSWLIEKSKGILKWNEWLEKFSHLQLKQVFGTNREWILGKIPIITDALLRVIASNIERVVAAIELPKLVEEQVQHFPIERLEQIILSVSGKEFRAITWLGAFLGGIIGLFQAIMLLWYL